MLQAPASAGMPTFAWPGSLPSGLSGSLSGALPGGLPAGWPAWAAHGAAPRVPGKAGAGGVQAAGSSMASGGSGASALTGGALQLPAARRPTLSYDAAS